MSSIQQLFPARDSLVSGIPSGYGKIYSLFYSVRLYALSELFCLEVETFKYEVFTVLTKVCAACTNVHYKPITYMGSYQVQHTLHIAHCKVNWTLHL